LGFDLSGGAGELHLDSAFVAGTARIERSRWLRASTDVRIVNGIYANASGEWRAFDEGTELAIEIGRYF
jgi:hypothetical protein